eukprot:jgi/Botrbrau1/15346/Bobra.0289s0003.2
MGRELRDRKPVVYNVDALELMQGYGDIDNPAIFKNGLTEGRGKKRSHDNSSDHEEHELGDLQPKQRLKTTISEGESLEEASDSEDEFLNAPKAVKRRQSPPLPSRQQPRRAATNAGVIDGSCSENGNDSGPESEAENDDLPLTMLQDNVASGKTGRRNGPRSSAQKSNSHQDIPKQLHGVAKTKRTGVSKAKAGKGKEVKQQKKRAPKKENSRGSDGPTKKPVLKVQDIEKIIDVQMVDGKEKAHVKFKGKSYRDCQWLPTETLVADKGQLLRGYYRKAQVDEYGELHHGVHPDWLQVERIIAVRGQTGHRQYLVKWQGQGYSDSTWEAEETLDEDKDHINDFLARQTSRQGPRNAKLPKKGAIPIFQNERKLRDYQVESLTWIMENMRAGKNCILGDEMGLGKTAQSIAVLEFQHQLLHRKGPFLVVAPLTTLGHWQREIQTWTDMYCVQYVGSATDRDVIKQHELYTSRSNSKQIVGYKFNVLLTSYEMLLRDERVLASIPYDTVIIDEAHRMKSTGSQQRAVVDRMMASGNIKFLLLLTGTPIQNNLRELYGLLSLLDKDTHGDEEEFFNKFGGKTAPPTVPQVKALQEALRPILLRRMKEDVETLPEKEEVIVEVELTHEQRRYYKAIYSQQIGTLMAGASAKNLPNLRNLGMELRKCCNHPYLCNGLEDDILARQIARGESAGETERLINASGKMILLKKLLPKLHDEGRKVLIFSQFKIMLDVLEDAFRMMGYPTERIDGGVAQRDRQAAIDRFSKGDANTFIFLLSTRAGGQGITLTAADTVIIYDSDWNPQNDLQAMARCHRIGQSKEVTIYRLISRDTYEAQVFESSTRKYGLDEAILGNIGQTDDPENDDKRIADLLRHGAHGIVGQDEEVAEAVNAFQAEGIDSILANRTTKRTIGSRKGNTFSRAAFRVDDEMDNAIVDDRAYWAALMPEAVAAHDEQVAAASRPVELGKRERKAVNYRERARTPDESDDDKEHTDMKVPKERSRDVQKKVEAREKGPKMWTKHEVKVIEDCLISFGRLTKPDAQMAAWEKAGLKDRPYEEASQVRSVLIDWIRKAANYQDEKAAHKKAIAEWERRRQFASFSGQNLNEDAPIEKDWDAEPLISDDLQIPAIAAKALTAGDTLKRIRKNGRKHLDSMRERESFVRRWKENLVNCMDSDNDNYMQAFERVIVPKSDQLPQFWSSTYDEDLASFLFAEGFEAKRARETASAFVDACGSSELKEFLKDAKKETLKSEAPACEEKLPEEGNLDASTDVDARQKSLIDAIAKRAKQLIFAVTNPEKSSQMRHQAVRRAQRQDWFRRMKERERALQTAREAEAEEEAEEAREELNSEESEELVSEDEDVFSHPAHANANKPPKGSGHIFPSSSSKNLVRTAHPKISSPRPTKSSDQRLCLKLPIEDGDDRSASDDEVIDIAGGLSPTSTNNESNRTSSTDYYTSNPRRAAPPSIMQRDPAKKREYNNSKVSPLNRQVQKQPLQAIDLNRTQLQSATKQGGGHSKLVQSRLNFARRPKA